VGARGYPPEFRRKVLCLVEAGRERTQTYSRPPDLIGVGEVAGRRVPKDDLGQSAASPQNIRDGLVATVATKRTQPSKHADFCAEPRGLKGPSKFRFNV
jgi:hypothetical protein